MNIRPARIAIYFSLLASAQLGVVSSAYAQDADAAVNEYSAVLDQIQNVKIATSQRQVMMEAQKSDIASLREQIAGVPATKDSVRGIVTKMVAEIARVIESDLPFRKEEREARLAKMQTELADESSRPVDLFRRAMTLYDVEANYGYSISAYTGDHPTSPGRRLKACQEDVASATCNLSSDQKKQLEAGASLDGISGTIKDGNYVHFGRMSFIYLDLDSREGFRWSKEANGWEPLSSGDILKARKSVRIARGESAPGVVTAPIKMQASQ